MVIELCVVQFWSKIIRVISKSRIQRKFDLKSQNALHSVKLPLQTNYGKRHHLILWINKWVQLHICILCLFTLNFCGQMLYFSRREALSLHLVFLGWMTINYKPNSVWLLFTLDIVRRGDHCLDEVTTVLPTWPGGATYTASQSAPRREELAEEEEEDGWFHLDPAEHQLEVDLNSVDMVTT